MTMRELRSKTGKTRRKKKTLPLSYSACFEPQVTGKTYRSPTRWLILKESADHVIPGSKLEDDGCFQLHF